MEESTAYVNGTHRHYLSSSSSSSSSVAAGSLRHVCYSCGTCGYELNLSSSNRNTSTISSKYGKSIKRGIISFFYIDESRFTLVDELKCIPYFSNYSWHLFRRKTKLLCRKCGNYIGRVDRDKTSTSNGGLDEVMSCKKYDIRIRALQPSTSAHD